MITEEFDIEICKSLDEIRTTLKDQIKHIEDTRQKPEMRAMMAAVLKMTVDSKWNELLDMLGKRFKQQKKDREKANNNE